MKLRQFSKSLGRREAFTMVEIAISIAVVAFALVAIMGVLPTGMTVEKDNREDTLINQEGQYWLEVIRTGGRGNGELTNYVESITITNNIVGALVSLTNGIQREFTPELIVGLLTTPKILRDPLLNFRVRDDKTNRVSAIVKAITGAAAEKGPMTGPRTNEFAFRYMLEVSVIPDESLFGVRTNELSAAVRNNLQDVRLVLRWPVYERAGGYAVGNNRKTFRAKVSGLLEDKVDGLGANAQLLWFIKPNQYANVVY